MGVDYLVIASFPSGEGAKQALVRLEEEGLCHAEVFLPFLDERLADYVCRSQEPSRLAPMAFVTGVSACLGVFLIAPNLSMSWLSNIGFGSRSTYPAHLLQVLSCMVFFSSIAAFVLMLVLGWGGGLFGRRGASLASSGGLFGLSLRVPKEKKEETAKLMRLCGASSVEYRYVR